MHELGLEGVDAQHALVGRGQLANFGLQLLHQRLVQDLEEPLLVAAPQPVPLSGQELTKLTWQALQVRGAGNGAVAPGRKGEPSLGACLAHGHDGEAVEPEAAELARDLGTVEVREVKVQKQQVGVAAGRSLDAGQAAADLHDLETGAPKCPGNPAPFLDTVLHQEHASQSLARRASSRFRHGISYHSL